MPDHPLKRLDGLPLGRFSIHLGRLEPMRKSGWRFFSFHLRSPDGRISTLPAVEGIYSAGGRGVSPWIEVVNHRRRLELPGGPDVDLAVLDLERDLFRHLHDLLVPGSHIMLWYEGDSGRETEASLQKGIPPVLTPLGSLLFEAGFRSVRDFYLPEGGSEGGRKLWGERPSNDEEERAMRGRAVQEASSYLRQAAGPDPAGLHRRARETAHRILGRSADATPTSEP